MPNRKKIALLKETKIPTDRRVALTPKQGIETLKQYPRWDVFVQPSNLRGYKDEEYNLLGHHVVEDISHCDLLIGIKEVAIETLIPDKTYMFFSHTAKKQSYNRPLLQEILKKNITLIDYEYLTDKNGARLVAFGHWAGVVGAYNALIGWGKKTKAYELERAYLCHDMIEMVDEVKKVKLPNVKILITGGGRVAHGALQTLSHLNLKNVSPSEFLTQHFNEPVVCQIEPHDYVKHKDGKDFDLAHFFQHPDEYVSTFLPYTKVTDILIPCHFWDPRSPVFFTKEHIRQKDFKIQIIADISCDIKIPIPSTLRASTIAEPFYGYNPCTEKEDDPWSFSNITVMSVDNLPGELPRDASQYFGDRLMENIFPHLLEEDKDGVIERATIAKGGKLTERFAYLENYVKGIE
ncbi:MAG: alanine dehydrogenase [Bacteroidetes bacterium RIFOXYA12_FULL_35_11]|nr:MAG: alanine dehydrogenase [Bacteroidetes bacterium GWF2_35_48]OFY76807.1 MAG: alanine dehydrogenase [Bacteroidetes bacterium RIFOXYA12_FULL_35_11]OFY97109.1 MAG: alanine dehydrogenase [Bacteroidetes bacterium RIFOXYB2_FULL_35_7]HBX49846.1 alanine dehydrogenase [Bacteroidales bacterium]